MKRKYAAMITGVVLSASVMCTGVYAAENETEAVAGTESQTDGVSSATEKTEDGMNPMQADVMGEISAVTEDAVTVTTQEGEEKEVSLTENTEYVSMSMGGGAGQAPDGQAPDGEVPELPENAGDGQSADGQAPDGEVPELPENAGDGQGADGQAPDGEVPELPENAGDGQAPDGEVPELPENAGDGQAPDGQAPQMPGGNGGMGGAAEETITRADLAAGDQVAITLDEDGAAAKIVVMINMENGQPGGGGQPGGMGSGGVDSYDAVNDYTEDTEVDGETISSTGTDENAVHVSDGASVKLSNLTVSRESQDSQGGDNSSFYGVGAAILATDGTAYVSDSTIDTDAGGAAGIFAYGDGTVYAADTKITTSQGTSGGIHAAGGGTLYAWNLEAETSGQSSAAIRSDRGGGTMVVDGGTYTSNGVGSPAIYSTADIAVNDATLTANGSEAICIEGLNSIHLYDSDLSGNMSDDAQNDCTWNVILYQSMSGDSEVGNSTFEMDGGTLSAENGGMFYTTNTESTFVLSGVNITYAPDSDFFLRCTGNANERGWGTTGSNGADCNFTAIGQEMQGDIIWDSISDLDFYMTSGSVLRGAVTDDETNAGAGGEGYCNLYLDTDSTWQVTGDSTLSALSNAGTIVDENGSTVTIQGTDGTVYVEGDSDYTVTVETYEADADLSGAAASTSWNEYAVEKPAEL